MMHAVTAMIELNAPRGLARAIALQALTEFRLRFLKGISFRTDRNEEATRAYCLMEALEFESVNARQHWANWRTIPRSIRGILPRHPIFAIDLCCGTGHSTQVITHQLPPGSQVLALEFNPAFVSRASSKQYTHANGRSCAVSFNTQSVLEYFRDELGRIVPAGSADWVNSSGAVGCHFKPEATWLLAREIARVLRTGGIATVDSGWAGTRRGRLIRIFDELGFRKLRFSRSCAFDIYTQVSFRKEREIERDTINF